MGHKGVEGKSGTISVPLAFVLCACWITLGINPTGGNHQLTSCQSNVKVSTALVSG